MATVRLMYFEGRVPADNYVLFSLDTPEFTPSEDYARPGRLLVYEVEFDTQDGKGEAAHLPIEEELYLNLFR